MLSGWRPKVDWRAQVSQKHWIWVHFIVSGSPKQALATPTPHLRYYGYRVMKVTHVRPNSGMIVRSGRPNRFPFLMQGSLLVSCLLATKAREHQLPSRGPCRGLNRVSQSYVTGSFAVLDYYQHLSGFWWFWTPVAPKDIELKLMIFESLWALRSLERSDLTDRRFIVVFM
jgi:hypothetical protein